MSIFGGLRQKEKKDLCLSCRWYYPENGTCQIKKCAGRGGPGYVTRGNRKHCKGYEPKTLAKVTNVEKTDGGLKVTADLLDGADETLQRIRDGFGIDPLPRQTTDDEPGMITLWADNVPMETLTLNEIREANGFKRKFLGEPYCTPDDELLKNGDIRCEYCGRINSKRHRICDGCGAPL